MSVMCKTRIHRLWQNGDAPVKLAFWTPKSAARFTNDTDGNVFTKSTENIILFVRQSVRQRVKIVKKGAVSRKSYTVLLKSSKPLRRSCFGREEEEEELFWP